MASSPWITDVDETNFEEVVLEQSQEALVLVDFWAEWCGPCRMLTPVIEAQVQKRGGTVRLAKIDVDKNQLLAMQFRVQSIPYVACFYQGKLVDEFMGVVPEPELVRLLDRHAPKAPEGDAEPKTEADHLATLETSPKDPVANLALAQLHLERDEDEEARKRLDAVDVKLADDHRDAIDRLGALLALRALGREAGGLAVARAAHETNPDDPQALYRVGCALAAAGDYPAALELLLAAGAKDKELLKSHVREAMVHCFYALGSRDPVSDKYRDELTNLFYA